MAAITGRRIRVETGSDDECGVLLFADGRLLACLIQLIDEGHGALRGSWSVEAFFNPRWGSMRATFGSVDAAANAVTRKLFGEALPFAEPLKDC